MKRLALLLALPLLILSQSDLRAQNLPDFAGRWYVSGDIGPSFMQDVDVNDFLAPVSGVEMEFDVGMQLSAGGGFFFTDWLALEGQTGFATSYLDEIKGMGFVDVGHSSLTQVPFLMNVVFQYPNRSGLVPYGGVGGGVSISVFDADEITDYATYYVDGADSDAVGAFQAFGGLRYELNPQLELGLVYRYLQTGDSEWDVNGGLTPVGDIAIDGVEVHSVNFTFRMRF